MKRSKLKRTQGLTVDAVKARKFQQRGRGKLKADEGNVAAFVQRGRESGSKALRDSARAGAKKKVAARAIEGPLYPAQWRDAAYRASGGVCIISRTRADGPDDPSFDAHHPLPKRELRARGLYAYVWDPRNALWLSSRVHERQEGGSSRVPGELLPASVWEFCAELDELAGTQWATALVERLHPATGRSGSRTRR